MDEQDKRISQKVSGLNTPPPGTNWRPERSWGRVQEQLQIEKDVRQQQLPWYCYAAAAFVILLVPFAVMLSDIHAQQARIDRLAAQLESTRSKEAQPAAVQPIAEPIPLPEPALAKAKAPVKEEVSVKRTPKVRKGRAVHRNAQYPEALPAAEPAEALLTQHPAPAAPKPAADAQRIAPAENSAAKLLRVVNTGPRRKPSSVTIVFEGTGDDPTSHDVLAAETAQPAPAREKRFFRVFQGSKPQEDSKPPVNILSVLNKKH